MGSLSLSSRKDGLNGFGLPWEYYYHKNFWIKSVSDSYPLMFKSPIHIIQSIIFVIYCGRVFVCLYMFVGAWIYRKQEVWTVIDLKWQRFHQSDWECSLQWRPISMMKQKVLGASLHSIFSCQLLSKFWTNCNLLLCYLQIGKYSQERTFTILIWKESAFLKFMVSHLSFPFFT